MLTVSHKAKQFLILTAKLLIVAGAFYFIYNRLADNNDVDWQKLLAALKTDSIGIIALILLLTFLNRFIEILKWQNLVSWLQHLSLSKATEQVLAGVTTGIFTPNGIGEYAAKALYFKKQQAKTIIFLNLICNGIQLFIAVIAGIIGLIIFNYMFNVLPDFAVPGIAGVLAVIGFILFKARKITIRGYSLQLLYKRIAEIPKKIHNKNNALALLRYIALLHQHYFIFLLFDVYLPYPVMISTIAAVYFVGSSLPTFQFLDFAVRGSVAVYFFGIVGVNEWVVVLAATLQWLLNIVIPVSIGSIYVINFKRQDSTTLPH